MSIRGNSQELEPRSMVNVPVGTSFAMLAYAYASGDWSGNYQGIDTLASRSGMGDLRFGFSFNFVGSPALKKEGFQDYDQKTISGFSLQVVAPTGQYYENKLINLGSNRWAFRPQLGISHRINTWHLEMAVNAWHTSSCGINEKIINR